MPRTDGIDVSKWQGTIDWSAVATTGITWAATRVWDRDLDRPDETFARNRTGMAFCRHRLLYYWLEPGRAAEGIEEFMSTIGFLGRGEGAMLDAEQSGIDEAQCLQWLEGVEAITQRPCAVYTGGYVAGGSIWHSTRIFNGKRPRIFAAYTSEEEAKQHADGIAWDAWQWTSSGHIPGINANCDIDQIDDAAAFDACCGLNGEHMLQIFKVTNAANPNAVYVTDGQTYRQVPDNNALSALTLFMTYSGLRTTVEPVSKAQVGFAGYYVDAKGKLTTNPYL